MYVIDRIIKIGDQIKLTLKYVIDGEIKSRETTILSADTNIDEYINEKNGQ